MYRQLGAYDGAETVLEEALRLREAQHGAGHAESASALRELALLRVAQADLGAAHELAERALAIATRTGAADSASLAASKRTLAQVLRARGAYADAEALYRQALGLVAGAADRDRERADLLTELGSVLRERGDYQAALPILREAARAPRARERALSPLDGSKPRPARNPAAGPGRAR